MTVDCNLILFTINPDTSIVKDLHGYTRSIIIKHQMKKRKENMELT